MSVITISRETGSGGHHIAEQVAHVLGYGFVDKNTIGRVYANFGSAEFGMEVGYVPDFWTRFDAPTNERRARMVDMLNQVILALAHQDNVVILGRSSFVVLSEFADVLNVRVQAPLPLRIKRIMERRGITELDQAEAIVRESDKVRAAFIERFYGRRWDSSKSFDLVIDTGKITETLAIKLLVQAVEDLKAKTSRALQTVGTIRIDPVLASIVSGELSQTSR